MFQLIKEIITSFRKCFKREKCWKWFAILIIGFMTRSEHRGITSILAILRLKPHLYHNILHFFRSSAYTTGVIFKKWIEIVMKHGNIQRVANRIILLGDHSKVSKEGKYMPDLQTLHQDSQNSGKAEYIEGHNYGQISTVITNGEISRSVPLVTELQKSPTKEEKERGVGKSLVEQMLILACKTAQTIDKPAVVALDAYFSSKVAWATIENKFTSDGQKLLEIVTRAQSNTVAFKIPEPPVKKKRGQPRIYGEKIKLMELFKKKSNFIETTMKLYGKITQVQYQCLDLIWKPIGKAIRFVAVETSRGKCVLMSSDLNLSPENIIEIYTLRFKIETSFDEQKNIIGCFDYHFWTSSLPKKKKFKKIEAPIDEKSLQKINATRKAIDAHVCLSTIATGILSLIAFSHSCEIWNYYTGWVRTLRSTIPTVAIVKSTISRDVTIFSVYFPFISKLVRKVEYLYQKAA